MNYQKSVGNSSSFAQKWSPEVEQYGFTQLPNLLICCQGHLMVTDNELVTLIQLLSFWYAHDGQVFPSIETLAGYSNKGYSTIQKRLPNLEAKGFIKRIYVNGKTSLYDVRPCVIKLYKHQRVCPHPPKKREEYGSNTREPPPSNMKDKEYYVKRKLNKKVTVVGEILSNRIAKGI